MEMAGLSTLECAQHVVSCNSNIASVNYRKYVYLKHIPTSRKETLTAIHRNDFLRGINPHDLIEPGDENSNVALDATIRLSGGATRFFLMMDMQPEKSLAMQAFIESRIREQILPHFGPGFLLESGSSYQYLGLHVVDHQGLLDFLGRSLLMSIGAKISGDAEERFIEVPDTRFIGHSLLRRSTGLRVTTRGTKSFKPQAIALID